MMKMKGMLLILLIAVMLTAFLSAGCSRSTNDKTASGEASSDSAGGKVKIDTADGKVEVENMGKDGKVDVKVTGPEGETVVKGSNKDGNIDIKVAGPDGIVNIKGTEDGDKHVVNVDGAHGSVKVTTEGGESEALIEGVDGVSKVNVNKNIRESDFEIKFYPDSEIVEGSISDAAGPTGKTMKNKHATLNCTGELSAVKKFYVSQFDNPTVIEDENEITITSGNPTVGKTDVITIRKSDEEGKIEVNIISHNINM